MQRPSQRVRLGAVRIGARGFSLLEIMLALVLLAAIGALALPSFRDTLDRATGRDTARQVEAAVNGAADDSQRLGIPLAVGAVSSSTGCILVTERLGPRSEEAGESAGEADRGPAGDHRRTILRLPDGYTIGDAGDAETTTDRGSPGSALTEKPRRLCIYWPTGEATPVQTLTMKSAAGGSYAVTVGAVTGVCRVSEEAAAATAGAGKKHPAPAVGAPQPDSDESGME